MPRQSSNPVLDSLKRFGVDAMSFLALEPGMNYWFDESTGACVAYVESAGSWIAAAGPLAPSDDRTRAAERFAEAARASGKRASFFATESLEGARFERLLIGEQPIFGPREWLDDLPRRPRLREQLRRARAKGVTVRRVCASELERGSESRKRIEELARDWLSARHMEPMAFLATLELFCEPQEHRYVLAERDGSAVAFLSAVPIHGQNAWLVEDVVRSRSAPNGTTEMLIHALMTEVRDSSFVTLGLTPLSGDVAWPLRLARLASRPLFDFEGLRAFRARLHPRRWQPVWLVHPREQSAIVALFAALRAFANGALVSFGARSIVAHPSGPPWLLALPLLPWTLGLALLAAFGRPSVLGFDLGPRIAWVAFDAILAIVLYRTAMRPRAAALMFTTLLAGGDAALSILHIATVGFGASRVELVMRCLAVLAPSSGAAVLAWATLRAVQTSARQPDLH